MLVSLDHLFLNLAEVRTTTASTGSILVGPLAGAWDLSFPLTHRDCLDDASELSLHIPDSQWPCRARSTDISTMSSIMIT